MSRTKTRRPLPPLPPRKAQPPIPPCAASMGCLCAGHARGNAATEPCDTTEYEERDASEVLDEIRDLLDVEEDTHSAITHTRIIDAVKELIGTRDKLFNAIEDAFGKAPDDTGEACTEIEKAGERIDSLREMLAACVRDREALLKRAGLTDRQWSAQGGACASDFENGGTS